ncbi:peptidoglycan DD-metalloendopeptidase family protein [Exiguobacterium artemiae]
MKRMITTMTMTALMASGFATTGTEKVEAATTYKVKVTADGLRVRTGPSTAYKVVGSVNSGQTFNYLGVSGSWTKISYGGTSRYISSTYAKKYSVTTSTKASSGFSRPASGPITQGYGGASGVYGYTFHNGIDIGAPTGTPVYASAGGTVITSRYYGAYGNHIMMKSTVNGVSYTTVYAHLNSRSVYVGQTIAKGTKIGTIGATGNAFGAHLHFEMHRGSYVYSGTYAANSVNPLNYFN